MNEAHTIIDCPARLTSTGETVDVATLDGANAFLEQPTGTDGFNFFSVDLKLANVIRKRERKKGKLNNADRQTLRAIYGKVYQVAMQGELELFREKVPKTELEAYLNHANEILRQITNDRKWINTGNLLQHDNYLMTSLGGLFRHPMAVALVLDEISVLETISDMILSLEKPPSVDYADRSIAIVEYINQCSVEGSMLAIQPSAMLKDLIASPAYLQKRFKEGTPCGDTVRAIVKGTNGHSPCTRVLSYMNTLIRLSTPNVAISKILTHNDSCHFCRKRGSEEDLKCCAKCGQARYCSKECQRAHWKTHKKVCEAPLSRREEKNSSASEHFVTNFLFRNYVIIMNRMVEECHKAGDWNFDQMILELDLRPDDSGTIPLMKSPPEFRVVPFTKYLDGTWSNDPDSIFAGREMDSSLTTLKSQQSRRKSTELLCIVAYSSGSLSYQLHESGNKITKKQEFCQEALDAFRSLRWHKDFTLLWEIFSCEEGRKYILRQYSMDKGIPPGWIVPS